MRSALLAVVGCLALTSLAGCGPDGSDGRSGQDDVTLRIFAAASLTEPFTELAERFEEDNPGTEVELNLGPSSGLARQISSGAPADVFASASPTEMDTLVQADEANAPEDFARNSMQVAVPVENPGNVSELADLAKPDLKIALCQAQVPCGKVAAEVFAKADLTVRAATEEVDVKSVLTKVTLGEVDAGVVYVSDVLAAGDKVRGIEIPPSQNASTTYPVATLARSEHQQAAAAFVDLVLSAEGREALDEAGFQSLR